MFFDIFLPFFFVAERGDFCGVFELEVLLAVDFRRELTAMVDVIFCRRVAESQLL